jgi:serine/threonine-protein kinase
MGYYYYHGFKDYEKGLKYINKAAAVAPNNVEAVSAISFIERRQGKFEDSLRHLNKVFELDPLAQDFPLEASAVLIRLRRYPEAQKLIDRSLELAPNQVYGYGIKQANIIFWKGDLAEARRVLEKMPDSEPAFSNAFWFHQEFLERNYPAALARLDRIPVEVFQEESRFTPKLLLQADAELLLKQESAAREDYEKARIFLEAKINERPKDAAVHMSLSQTYAGLGRKEDAIREAKLAVDLLPVSRDAFVGPHCLTNLAEVYCRVGEYDKALDEIDHLLSIPSWFSVHELKISPWYDPVRNLPRYKQIVEKYSYGVR